MKVLWALPKVERNFYVRPWGEELEIKKTTNWYKGPKNKKWWRMDKFRVEYHDCPWGVLGGPAQGVKPCSKICFWSDQLRRWRHRERFSWIKQHSNWIRQERGLCIDRNLTSWIFRWRHRRTKAAIKIQRWYKAIFPLRLFKHAKAHFNSCVNYEPSTARTVRDPNRKAGEEIGDVLAGNPRTSE